MRAGAVNMMQPVHANPNAISTSTKRQMGGMLGRVLGHAVTQKTGYSYEA